MTTHYINSLPSYPISYPGRISNSDDVTRVLNTATSPCPGLSANDIIITSHDIIITSLIKLTSKNDG